VRQHVLAQPAGDHRDDDIVHLDAEMVLASSE
jgi:hypothetical protein